MKFETVFDKGERAWYMKDNKPTQVIISAIHIFAPNTNQDSIKYSARDCRNPVSWIDHQNLFEYMLFRTKEHLVESLLGVNRTCTGKECSAVKAVGHSEQCIQEHEEFCSGVTDDMPGFEGTKEQLQRLGI